MRASDGTLEGFHDDGRALAYVDAEGSVLCAPCARKAERDRASNPPSWLPQTWYAVPDAGGDGLDDLCDACGEALDPRERPVPPAPTGPHAACVRTFTITSGCPDCMAELAASFEGVIT